MDASAPADEPAPAPAPGGAGDAGADPEPLRVLVGTTASGKTALSLEVAERAGAEIVSMDSMLVYRGMDVGTAKPDAAERARVPHHLLDLVDPAERYDVQRWLADAEAALADVARRGRRALLVGGTALYLKALLRGLFDGPPPDPALRARVRERVAALGPAASHAELARVDPRSAARIHANDARRVARALEVLEQTGRALSDWQDQWGWHGAARGARPAIVVGLEVDPAGLDERIRARTRAMLAGGWLDEVRAVRAGRGFGPTASQALGLSEVLRLDAGELTEEDCAALVDLRTRQFARRQRTWFRKLPVRWVPAPAEGELEARAGEVLELLGWDPLAPTRD